MKHIPVFFLLLFFSLFQAQNTFKYTSYKSAGIKKDFSIIVNYNDEKELNYFLLQVESKDIIYNKSTFILDKIQYLKFTAYLNFLATKLIEYDHINKLGKIKKVEKYIEWEENMTVYCSYEDGPKQDVELKAIYLYQNGFGSLMISTSDFEQNGINFKRSQIYFNSINDLKLFINKIDNVKVQEAINKNYDAKSRLK